MSEPTKQAYRVLVVEDDQHLRAGYVDILELDDYIVQTAENGRVALELAPEFDPHIIMMNWIMPFMDGVTAIQALRKIPQFEHTPIVVTTARGCTHEEAIRIGADALLIVPFDAEDYLALVAKMLNKTVS